MPRTYKPAGVKQYKKYSDIIIHTALKEYKTTNLSLAQISKKYDISKSVLHRHNTRFMKKHGGQMVLSAEEEEYIIEYLNHCSEWGYPLDTYDLRVLVKGYLDRIGIDIKRFKDNLPGPDFVKSFLRRNRDKISLRISQNIKRARANVSLEEIEEYFLQLEKSLEGVPLFNIVNYDETSLSDDPGRKKILTKRGAKYPERIMNHSKVSTSLMMAASADGTLLPCYVVYKAKNMYESWVQQGPKGCRYNCTTSGWFDGKCFEDWVQTVALPYFKEKEGKHILIGDNLSSHLSLSLIKECKEHNVHFVFLPANSTHLTQPLDVAFFRPTKAAWREILFSWKKTEGRTLPTIPKSVFPMLLKKLVDRIESKASSNILAGFNKCGISPLNKNKVIERLPGQIAHEDRSFDKDALGQTVVKILKEMRYDSDCKKSFNKRKKIEYKPGQSVCTENEDSDEGGIYEQISEHNDTDSEQNASERNKPRDTTKNNLEVPQKHIAKISLDQEKRNNEENSAQNITNMDINKPGCSKSLLIDSVKSQKNIKIVKVNSTLKRTHESRPKTIAKLIPEERKIKFEAKYAADTVAGVSSMTPKIYNVRSKKEKDEHIFKKPYDVKNKRQKESIIESDNKNFKHILDNRNDFSDIVDMDIENLPIVFDENFFVQEFVEIGTEMEHNTLVSNEIKETNTNIKKEIIGKNKIFNENTQIINRIKIISDKLLKPKEKVEINLKAMKKHL